MNAPTYRVSTYDTGTCINDPWDWSVRAVRQDLMRLRWWIRTLRAMGYEDDLSILVERELEGGGEADA